MMSLIIVRLYLARAIDCDAFPFRHLDRDLFVSELMLVFFFFFFSSRRRHTRCLSDWSSDVCSSDLADRACLRELPAGRGGDVEPARSDRQQFLLPEQLRLLRAGRLQGHAEAHVQPWRPLADPDRKSVV